MEGDFGGGFDGGTSDRTSNICYRCGSYYHINDDSCPVCKNLTEEQAEEHKRKLINARVDKNENIGYLFFALALIIIILFVVM